MRAKIFGKQIYTRCFKIWDFSYDVTEIFNVERVTIAKRQGASEESKYDANGIAKSLIFETTCVYFQPFPVSWFFPKPNLLKFCKKLRIQCIDHDR